MGPTRISEDRGHVRGMRQRDDAHGAARRAFVTVTSRHIVYVHVSAASPAHSASAATVPAPMSKVRLDTLLAERGLFASRARAAASVMAGEVRLGDARRARGQARADGPRRRAVARRRAPALRLARRASSSRTRSTRSGVDVEGRRCLDVGASTGGFTRLPAAARRRARRSRSTSPTASSTGRCASDERVTVLERVNARALRPEQLPYAPDLVVVDVSFISLTKVLPAVLACCARAPRRAGDGQAAVRGRPRARRQGRRRARRAARARRRSRRSPSSRRDELRRGGARLRAVRAAGSQGQPRDVRAPRRARPRRGARRPRGGRAGGWRRERRARDHRLLARAAGGDRRRAARARRARGRAGHHRAPRPRGDAQASARSRRSAGVEADAEIATDVDIAIALGGDGTILRALRSYAHTSVPVFGVNFGEIGFLATVEREEARAAFAHALAGDFETLTLPAIADRRDGAGMSAINDVAIHRRAGERVAELAYAVGGQEVGRVRCDGLVVATPAGSTGYNLANGGPVLAWGVEGYVVSFIAPHSLTARALVVAPDDLLTVHNRSASAVDVSIDGRPGGRGRARRRRSRSASCARPPTSRCCPGRVLPPAARDVRAPLVVAERASRLEDRRPAAMLRDTGARGRCAPPADGTAGSCSPSALTLACAACWAAAAADAYRPRGQRWPGRVGDDHLLERDRIRRRARTPRCAPGTRAAPACASCARRAQSARAMRHTRRRRRSIDGGFGASGIGEPRLLAATLRAAEPPEPRRRRADGRDRPRARARPRARPRGRRLRADEHGALDAVPGGEAVQHPPGRRRARRDPPLRRPPAQAVGRALPAARRPLRRLI